MNSDDNSVSITLPFKAISFSIPTGCYWEESVDINNKNGSIYVFNSDKSFYALLQFTNNKLNGLSTYFNHGVIQYSISYRDDVAEGWACEFKSEKPYRFFWYTNGEIQGELFLKENSLWEEVDLMSHTILSKCSLDDNHCRNGIGYIYKNGQLGDIVLYDNNELVRILKSFENSVMKEFDEKGELIYEGEYSDDYSRNGQGKEFINGIICYSGDWKNNKKDGKGTSFKNNSTYYDGEWKDDVFCGKGIMLAEDGSVLHSGEWENGEFVNKVPPPVVVEPVTKDNKKQSRCKDYLLIVQFIIIILLLSLLIVFLLPKKETENNSTVVVRSREDFLHMGNQVQHIIIPSNTCKGQDFTDLNLEHFDNLQIIEIGDNALHNVYHTSFNNLKSLHTISIGRNSFSSNKTVANSALDIYRCNLLRSVSIGSNSFSSFSKVSVEGKL